MTANKMPEMPEAPKDQALSFGHTSVELLAFAEAYGRACYLAGLEAAKACVPPDGSGKEWGPEYKAGVDACRATVLNKLANLTALEQEAKK